MPRASTLIARPALRRLPTRQSRLLQGLIGRLLPLVFRLQGLELRGGNAFQGLAQAFAEQQAGTCTLLIAFRHRSPQDLLVLADLFWNRFAAEAAALHQPLPRPIELRFLDDCGIPIWAGPVNRLAAAAQWWNRHSSGPTRPSSSGPGPRSPR